MPVVSIIYKKKIKTSNHCIKAKAPSTNTFLKNMKSTRIHMFCLMHRESKRTGETEAGPAESNVKGLPAEGIHCGNKNSQPEHLRPCFPEPFML